MYQIPKNELPTVSEPAVAYGRDATHCVSTPEKWNPNVPFHGTQEEWWEHFHRIEQGEFMSIEEADKEFNAWKKEYLASRM
jgi:hypothetical protein